MEGGLVMSGSQGNEAKDFSSYMWTEGRTATGHLVEVACRPDETDEVKDFFKNNVRAIDVPDTKRVNVSHGGYGQYTRYNITQHKYGGGGHPGCGGYMELLEIENPPDDRCGVVINQHVSGHGDWFIEWESLAQAKKAWDKSSSLKEKASEMPGFIRIIECGHLTPWFYAIGEQALVGDFAFPHGMEDDPVFTFGRQFVVTGYDGIPVVKTCMGCRHITEKRDGYSFRSERKEIHYRLIFWDDGTVLEDHYDGRDTPRPIEQEEEWISDVLRQFQELLAGSRTQFEIKFLDGSKFQGKWLPKDKKKQSPAGDYFLIVHIKEQRKPLEGWVTDFKPTKKAPTIIDFVTQRYIANGRTVERIEIRQKKIKKGGQKWTGVFYK